MSKAVQLAMSDRQFCRLTKLCDKIVLLCHVSDVGLFIICHQHS